MTEVSFLNAELYILSFLYNVKYKSTVLKLIEQLKTVNVISY